MNLPHLEYDPIPGFHIKNIEKHVYNGIVDFLNTFLDSLTPDRVQTYTQYYYRFMDNRFEGDVFAHVFHNAYEQEFQGLTNEEIQCVLFFLSYKMISVFSKYMPNTSKKYLLNSALMSYNFQNIYQVLGQLKVWLQPGISDSIRMHRARTSNAARDFNIHTGRSLPEHLLERILEDAKSGGGGGKIRRKKRCHTRKHKN